MGKDSGQGWWGRSYSSAHPCLSLHPPCHLCPGNTTFSGSHGLFLPLPPRHNTAGQSGGRGLGCEGHGRPVSLAPGHKTTKTIQPKMSPRPAGSAAYHWTRHATSHEPARSGQALKTPESQDGKLRQGTVAHGTCVAT